MFLFKKYIMTIAPTLPLASRLWRCTCFSTCVVQSERKKRWREGETPGSMGGAAGLLHCEVSLFPFENKRNGRSKSSFLILWRGKGATRGAGLPTSWHQTGNKPELVETSWLREEQLHIPQVDIRRSMITENEHVVCNTSANDVYWFAIISSNYIRMPKNMIDLRRHVHWLVRPSSDGEEEVLLVSRHKTWTLSKNSRGAGRLTMSCNLKKASPGKTTINFERLFKGAAGARTFPYVKQKALACS